MPRRGANAHIDFNTVIDLSRQQGYDAQHVLGGLAFNCYPNETERREALEQVLTIIGIIRRIDITDNSEETLRGHTVLTDCVPTITKRIRSVR